MRDALRSEHAPCTEADMARRSSSRSLAAPSAPPPSRSPSRPPPTSPARRRAATTSGRWRASKRCGSTARGRRRGHSCARRRRGRGVARRHAGERLRRQRAVAGGDRRAAPRTASTAAGRSRRRRRSCSQARAALPRPARWRRRARADAPACAALAGQATARRAAQTSPPPQTARVAAAPADSRRTGPPVPARASVDDRAGAAMTPLPSAGRPPSRATADPHQSRRGARSTGRLATLRGRAARRDRRHVVRVTLDFDGEVAFDQQRLAGPVASYFDFAAHAPSRRCPDAVLQFEGPTVRHIRLGRPRPDVTRARRSTSRASRTYTRVRALQPVSA